MSSASTQMLVSKYNFLVGTGCLGRFGAGKVQDKPAETYARKWGNGQIMIKTC